MKLRFGIDETSLERMRTRLNETCEEPPVGRRLSYVYLDTPDGDLEKHGVAVRFRRSAAIGTPAPGRRWKRQELWRKKADDPVRSVKKLGIRRLKQRLDATFSVRIERWSWTLPDAWAAVSLDRTAISTGRLSEEYAEMRVVCRRRHLDAAMRFAVGLGAMQITSVRARERGQSLLEKSDLA